MKIDVTYIPSVHHVQVITDDFCHRCEISHDDIQVSERHSDCIADYYDDMDDFRAEMQTDNFSGDY